MNQIISNVLMQPKPDAVERLTLIEKLEREYQKWCELEDKSKFGSGEAVDARGRTRGLKDAINIVKQHSDWISVDERLPPEEIKLLFEHEDYGIIIGCYRKKGEFVTYDTHYNYREPISKFIKWCHIPPSEVQDD